MSSEGKSAVLDLIISFVGLVGLVTGIISFMFASSGSAWPLIPSILSILCFGWVATGISNIIYNL